VNQMVAMDATAETLPSLVDRAAKALEGARSYAEVLEARSMAASAADAASRAARLARSIDAHGHVVGTAHRLKADALAIELRAQRRIADEYDAAQERGEVRQAGNPAFSNSPEGAANRDDLGISRHQLTEFRQVRDAEDRDPGIVERTLNDAIARGEEPTRAEVKRAINFREDVMERAAKEEAAMRDKRDFRALRKLWNASSSNVQRMFRDYIGA
jgi:hypothetical protein